MVKDSSMIDADHNPFALEHHTDPQKVRRAGWINRQGYVRACSLYAV